MKIEEKNGKVYFNGMDIQKTIKENDRLNYENKLLKSALENIIQNNNTVFDTVKRCVDNYRNLEVTNEANI